jgi:hypothetical protein
VALALSLSGAFIENGTKPDRKALLSYIKSWNDELTNQQPEKDPIVQSSLFY